MSRLRVILWQLHSTVPLIFAYQCLAHHTSHCTMPLSFPSCLLKNLELCTGRHVVQPFSELYSAILPASSVVSSASQQAFLSDSRAYRHAGCLKGFSTRGDQSRSIFWASCHLPPCSHPASRKVLRPTGQRQESSVSYTHCLF